MLRRFLAIAVLFCFIFVPVFSNADELGEHILTSILAGKKPTDASLLLITRDLKWYEQNMGKLPAQYQARIQNLRIEVAGKSAQSAAAKLGEPAAIFGATGSWNPGRDMDMVYFGKNIEGARTQVNGAFEQITAEILSRDGPGDEILKSIPGIAIPDRLSQETMSLVVSDVPDFGYKELERAYMSAKEAFERGESREMVMKRLHDQIWEALGRNSEAHIASTAPDMYRGAGGQEWWSANYLENPQKMRTFVRDPETGTWSLKEGGLKAVPEEIAERVGFGAFKGRGGVKFSKIASDYAMFFKHEEGGLSDTAKYVYRIWDDVDGEVIATTLTMQDVKPFVVANRIAKDPQNAAKYLADAGMTAEDLKKALSDMLYRWTEKQLLVDTEKLVNELASHLLSAPSSSTDDLIADLVAKARLKFDLNDMASGLDILRQAPNDAQKKLVKALEARFGESEAGKLAIKYIKKQMRLLADEGGELTLRILKMLKDMGRIQDDQYNRAVKSFEETGKVTDDLADTVKTARKEVMLISSAGMFDVVDDPQALDRLMEEWRKFHSGAMIQSPNKELSAFRTEFRQLPDSELKRLGWTVDELRIPVGIKQKLPGGPAMLMKLEGKLGGKLAKSGVTIRQFQSKLHEILFNPAYAQLGDPSASVGALDAFIGVATGLYMTYDILFNQNLSPEEENLQLGNAWVTAIPVVGDFAQGLITGGQGWYEGDKGKVLEAGLWISIGVMGCVPGGQLPAVILGISLATKPLVVSAYDARQAQNLIRAWVESGNWAMEEKPRKLKGLFDRENTLHAISYEDLLTEKGNKPYKSETADGLLGSGVTMNDSIRAYAEQNVMPQFTAMPSMRDALKNLYPDFNDKDWTDEFTAKIKIEVRGGKGGLALFHAYYLIRTKALEQTLAQLKSWAEDEMRAEKDYDAEVVRLKGELQKLQDELKCPTLIPHADESVEAYSRVIKNVWEQESLPLSKIRIYEHYVKTYSTMAGKLRRVSDLFRECSAPYVPPSWHLTGFPEFDVDRVNTLLSSMENGRKGVIEHIEKLLKEFDQPVTKYNPANECHKKAFDVLGPLRYKVAFIENLILYYKQLAESDSTWSSAYDAAKQRYTQQRDSLMKQAGKSARDMVESAAFQEAFMTYVASIPYGLASKDAELYRSTSLDYEVRLAGAQKDYEMAIGKYGEGGKALQECLLAGLKVELTLTPPGPEEGQDITAKVKLTGGTPPKENSWYWKTSGGLKPSGRYGAEITLGVASEGTVTVELRDDLDRVLATASAPVKPKKKDSKKDEKKPEDIGVTGVTQADTGTKKDDISKEPPICSYKYSEWGECVRATKKQTRTVTARQPEGCVEKQKPALEQGCTPPPSEEDKKNAYLNCLCRCSSGWAGHIGVWYDPEGKSEPECKSSGPCFGGAGAFGCTRRHFFVGPNDCGKACWEAAYGKDTYDPKKADELRKSENKKYKKPLTAKITPSKNPADFGDIITLQAEAGEGSGGYSYQWGGCAQDAKDYQAKVANTRDCKPCAASVTITDQDGDSASATVTIQCNTVKVKLTKENPKENTVPVGGKASFYAEVFSGDKPFSGPTLFYVWERNPDAIFGDPKNPQYETSGGSQMRNTATFRKAGTTPVWVTVLREIDGKKVTIGESQQIPITVANPELTIKVAPEKPNIGQEVKLQVESKPAIGDDIVGFWWEIPGYWTGTGDKASFKPKDDKPVKVTVHAKTKDGGDEVGTKEVTITAQAFQVSISEPRYLESPPQVWKCDTQLGQAQHCGMVTLKPTEFAVSRDIFLKATLAPQPESPRYRWTVDPAGSCGLPGAGSEIKLNCSNTGTYSVKVEVTNADGAKLGEASQSVTVSVSQDAMSNSKKAKEAYDKLQKAKGLVAEGKLDEGIALANESANLDPKNTEAKSLSQKWGGEKQTVTQQLEKAKKLIMENHFDQAEKDFVVAQKLHPKYFPVVETEKLLKTKKDDYKKNVAGKLADAKIKAGKGDYDGAIHDAEAAAKSDPANKEAPATAQKLRQEKDTIHQQIDKAKKLMDENKFADAQKELIVASNLNSYYPPVPAANQELGTRWGKYNSEVRDKVYEVRSANEKKDFGKALEIAAAWRASTKLDPYAEKELKQQEDWSKQWKAQKDRQIGILKAGGEKMKNYDYAGALKTYDEGFANGQNIYNGSEPEYKEAVELRSQAFTKNKRLGELIPWVRKAAEDKESMPADALNNTLKTADEAIALQPNNEQLKKWREQIVARSAKTKEDSDRTAQGRKYLEAAGNAERSFANNESYVKANPGQWGEKLEEQQQTYLTTAIQNYGDSLKFIPDAAVEKKIKDLQATLEGRKKYLEQYRQSRTLLAEADALYKQATQDPDIQSASPKYDEAAAKYGKSLSLYRPFNAENIEKTIYVLEQYKHERWVKKYWADGQALEKQGKLVEALAAYDKAIASLHPTTDQRSRLWYETQAQELRNKINGAKTWRADGEAKQKAGKIAEAIASYKQSLALLPDAALAEHVRMLEGKQAEAGEKKAAAEKLWQEGTALFNQGRPSDALAKFKESLGYFSDATRTKYVTDLEARRAKATTLRDEGAKLQQGNRIPEAIAKYKESLSYWPDTGLSSHIATLEGKLKQDADTAARKAKAKQLRDEGYALQQKNQLQAAVGKYKESLAILPDKQLEDYIRQLEAKIVATPPVVTPTPPVTTPTAASYDGTYNGTVSGGSTGTVQFTVSGTAVTGTVNGKYGQDAYRATLSGTLNRSTGEISTQLAGEVTGTSFQGGLKGRIQGSSASGDWHARNQYGNPTGTWQASRGGIRKTEPTMAGTTAGTSSVNIVGRWRTETIERGKVDMVSYTEFSRDGSYTMDVSGPELAGTAVCMARGTYTLSGQTLTLKPSGVQCKFQDGTTRNESVDRNETIKGTISGNDRVFTFLPGGNVSVRYTRQ